MKRKTMGNSGLGGPRSVLLAAIIAGLLAAPRLARIIQAARSENASSSITEEALENRNKSSIARLFGEFRASMSDIMFVKTERYLHSGIGYEKHLDYNKMAESGVIENEGDSHDQLAVVRTLIKAPGEDWRPSSATLSAR
jgi:hypothetical protein